MPHSTTTDSSSVPNRSANLATIGEVDGNSHMMEKFPEHLDAHMPNGTRSTSPRRTNGHLNGGAGDRWVPRRASNQARGVRWDQSPYGHGRQKSLSDAIRTIRTRHGSVSQNAQEIADALKAPVSPRLILLCLLWYTSSALTNTSTKSILNAFDKPATLTLIQFAFVASYCLLFSWLASIFPNLKVAVPALKHGIRYPNRDVIMTTLPLALFQIGGHLLSSTATSKIPVSLVHTIKGLSPLFTVLAYRLFFNIQYPTATYVSLIPLTLGVALACSGNHKFGGETLGVIYALLAAIIFVTQNIFSKKLFNEAAEREGLGSKSQKLDKLNLLCYSCGMAFVVTMPIWFWSEGIELTKDLLHDGAVDLTQKPNSFDHGRLALEFIFNGTFHFSQNILAFILLSLVSPVTYSVASLIKRVFVIVIAILWFQSPTNKIQAFGIGLTVLGLYLYDRAKEGNKADRKARMMTDSRPEPLLPLNTKGAVALSQTAPVFDSPLGSASQGYPHPYTNGYSTANSGDPKKTDENRVGRPRGSSSAGWRPPGTRQEDTWRAGDRIAAM